MKCYLLVATALSAVSAQVVYHPSSLRQSALDRLNQEKSLVSFNELVPVHQLPSINNELLVAAADLEQQSAMLLADGIRSGPYRFGKSFDAELELANGVWLDSGRVWFMDIYSESAESLSVRFDRFQMPTGAELYVSNPQTGEVRGPFTAANNKPSGTFAVFPMDGNRLRLELFNPPGSTEVPQLRVSSIVHGFRSISGGENNALTASGRSGSCNINVACKDADQWRNQVRSVAMVLTASGTGYCTGAMLNNGAKDGRQLFLTAYHCVGTKDVTDDMLLFNYQFDQCSPQPSQSFPSQKQTTHGLRKVAQWSRSDFALLEVEERIPEDYNVYLSGWTAAMDQVPVDPVGIHHPSADVKKISQMLGNCSHSTWGMRFSSPTEDPLAQQDHWRIQRWSRGTTEPGSSGSPLFDGVTGRVVGQLHGGSAACYNPSGYDAYGKLAYSFHRAGVPSKQMQQALDPHKQGLKSMDGMDLLAARRSASEASKNEQRVFSYRYSNSHVSK